jgi:hypothetical protein
LDRLWTKLHADLTAETSALTQSLADNRSARDRLLGAMEFLSPASLFWEAAGDAAGSGRRAAAAWNAAIERRHRQLRALIFDDPPRIQVRSDRQIYSFERGGGRRPGDVPAFRIDPAPLAHVNWRDVAVLTLYAGFCLTLSAWRVARRFR